MNRKIHVVLAYILAVVFLMNSIPAIAIDGNINSIKVLDKLNEIKLKYPDGSYFSVNGQPCVHVHNATCSNCELLNIRTDLKGKVADAWTCCAFARYVYYELFGIDSYGYASNSTEVLLENAKPGDLVMFYTGSAVTHYAIFLYSENGNNYVYESNFMVTNRVKYAHAYTAAQMVNTRIWHANNYVTDENAGMPTPTQAPVEAQTPTPTSTPTLSPTPSATLEPLPIPNAKPELTSSEPSEVPNEKPVEGRNAPTKTASIKMNRTKLELEKGKSFKLSAKIITQKSAGSRIVWLSGNKAVASVSAAGVVKGLKKGVTYVYAGIGEKERTKDARCLVIVK